MVEHPPICPEKYPSLREYDMCGGETLFLECGGDSDDCYNFNCESGYARWLAAGYQMFMWTKRGVRVGRLMRRMIDLEHHWYMWRYLERERDRCKDMHAAWFKWGLES